ncbi:hypothetical protein NIES2119_22120 [[Phormidium ambiguum] IAM M-71]|uniref:Telomere resolvase ResT/TelK catalytic domain-containing protein n=1 Tax=[Phormidium ambiguum] IAM M-71 TaxID=454136 RepID=A0A1U7IB19_9CYAN|nr:protelomerase family protein [Phormidium ambiguum]OKH33808.1 hypothetical protein NIES2119_22120 [Phormidium ambiguum IAM M-71]
MSLPASEQAKQREKIAQYSKEDLEDLTLKALQKLSNGVIPNATRKRKTELINELLESTKAERVLVNVIPNVPLEVISIDDELLNERAENLGNEKLVEWTHKFYQELHAWIESKQQKDGKWDDSVYGDIAGFAYRIVHYLNNYDGNQQNQQLSFLTKLRYRTHIINLIAEFIENERDQGSFYADKLSSCLVMLKRQVKIQLADVSEQKKGLQERRIAQRKKQKEIISFKQLYDFAVTTLNRIDEYKARDWKRVSVALAIVTGRRLAEIHRSATMFEVITDRDIELILNGEYGEFVKESLQNLQARFSEEFIKKSHVKFTGQLKAKGDADEYFAEYPMYLIPVLIEANLIVKAHQWLKDNGKTVADFDKKDGRFKSEERVKIELRNKGDAAHRRYSGDLSDFMKILKKRWNITHDFFTYKGLRAVYSHVCNQVFNNNDTDNELYLAQILGHGRGELLKHDDIIDTLTPQSYKSDFQVVDVDCVFN